MVNLNEFLSQETGFYSMPDSVKIMHRVYITRKHERGFLSHQVIICLLVSFSKLVSIDVQIILTACVKERKKKQQLMTPISSPPPNLHGRF